METMRSELAGCPVIIGAGLAGLMAALRLAPRPVILLAKVPLAEGAASAWAQGGIAAAVGEDDGRPCMPPTPSPRALGWAIRTSPAHRRGGAGRHHRAGPPRRGLRPRSGRPSGARPGGGPRPSPHRPRRRRRHRRRDHARAGRRGAGHTLDHRDRGPGSPPPAGRRPWRRGRAGGGTLDACLLPTRRRAGDRRDRRAVRPYHQPAGRHRPGAGAGGAGRRGVGRHGVRAVPPDGAGCRARSHAAGQRGGAR